MNSFDTECFMEPQHSDAECPVKGRYLPGKGVQVFSGVQAAAQAADTGSYMTGKRTMAAGVAVVRKAAK